MSKGKEKKRFNAPAETAGKYKQIFDRAKSEDTVDDIESESLQQNLDATDKKVSEYLVQTREPERKSKLLSDTLKILYVLAIVVGALVSVGVIISFFVGLKTNITLVSSDVGSLKTEVKILSNETKQQHNKMEISLARIFEKFDRLFDKLPFNNFSDKLIKKDIRPEQ